MEIIFCRAQCILALLLTDASLVFTVFNQKTLYDAHKKRTKDIEVDLDAYNRLKEEDPEFYRGASSLQYGKVSVSIFLDEPIHFEIFFFWKGYLC